MFKFSGEKISTYPVTAAVARKTSRTIHQWAAWVAAAPLFIIILSGVALQTKAFVPWIQPKALKGTPAASPVASWEQIIAAARTVPEAQVNGWEDVRVIDARPANNVVRLRTINDYEVQIDLSTGKLLSAAPRRTSWIIALHEGSFFGNGVRYAVFLPAGVLLLLLWLSGIVLALTPYLPKRRRAHVQEPDEISTNRVISTETI